MNKIFLSIGLLALIPFLGGCQNKSQTDEKEKDINPFSPTSMVDTYDSSKGKINNAVDTENDRINKAFEDSGLAE